jgi:FkbM family methyltransferase
MPLLSQPLAIETGRRLLSLPPARPVAGRVALKWAPIIAGHISDGNRYRVRRMQDGHILQLDLAQYQEANAYLSGEYERDTVRVLVDLLPPNGYFFDAGANVGMISVALGHRRPTATIIAVEAHPDNVAALKANVARNDKSIIVHHAALSDREGSITLHIGEESGHHSLAGNDDGIQVPAVTIDALLGSVKRVDVMKMDIEGAEVQALRGGMQTLERGTIKAIVCEVVDAHLERAGSSRRELFELLSSYGYTASPVTRRSRVKRVRITANVLFRLSC